MKKHKEKCKVCNSEHIKEIEKLYINGLSLREIILEVPGFNEMNIWNHVNAHPALRKKRDGNTEKILDRIIENGAIGKIKVDGALVLRAIEMKLKLQGKLDNNKGDKGKDVNVVIQIIQEGLEQVKSNRLKAYDKLGYPNNSDN